MQLLIPVFEETPLRILTQERKVLVLTVDVHEMRGKLLEKGQRNVAAVDEDRALARARNLAENDELVLALDLLLCEERRQSRIPLTRKYRLDAQGIAAAADGIRGDALSENRTKRVDQDGFTGAGLAREDVQPRTELDGNLLEQCKIPYAQTLQHSVSLLSADHVANTLDNRLCRLTRLDEHKDAVVARDRTDDLRPVRGIERSPDC